MARCPSPELLLDCFSGEDGVGSGERRWAKRHVGRCRRCQDLLEWLTQGQSRRSEHRRPSLAVPPGLIERLRGLAYGPPTRRGDLPSSDETLIGSDAMAVEDPIDEQVGPYRVLGVLGRGGMGVVLECHDPELDRVVAVKLLPARAATDQARSRFAREARAAARIDHPHVVPVHTFGVLPDGRPYLVMPRIEGVSLEDRLRTGPPPSADEAARIALGLAEGLAEVHRLGLVHRDVKPQNVLLGEDGVPRLTDFGLAIPEMGGERLTRTGQVLGTPAYMSPEQALGEGHRADPRADVYSLGVVLYRMLTGELPFRGNARMVLHQILNDDPRPPRDLNDRVPRDLQTICLKALEKEPERRYVTASALADDLRNVLARRPIAARPIGRIARLRRWARRHPAGAAAVGLAAAVLVLSVALAAHQTWAAERLARAQARTRDALLTVEGLSARLALDRGLAFCDQGEVGRGMLWMVRALDLAPATDRALAGAIRRNLAAWRSRLPTLRALIEAEGEVRDLVVLDGGRLLLTAGSDGTARLWDVTTGRPVGPRLRHDDAVTCAAVDPSGRLVATGGDDDTVRLWRLDDGQPAGLLARYDDDLNVLAFSPDGRRLLVGGDLGHAELFDVATGSCVARFEHPPGVESVAFSPDGRTIVTGGFDRAARLWDVESGRPIGEPLSHDGGVMALAFSADGRTLLTGSEDGAARLWDLESRTLVLPPLRHNNRVLDARFSPDERLILTASQDRTTRLWDAETGLPVGAPMSHNAAVDAVAFLPDGSAYWAGARDATARLWEVVHPRPALELAGHREALQDLAFSLDGSDALTVGRGGALRIWDLASGDTTRLIQAHSGVIFALAIHPDGRLALTGGKDGLAKLWDIRNGRAVGAPMVHGSPVYDLTFSPDGRLVATVGKDGLARLWDLAGGQAVAVGEPLDHGAPIYHLAFRPDGRVLLTAGEDGAVRSWDVATGSPAGSPMNHPGPVNAVAFASDGSVLATGDQLGTVRLWDAATGDQLGPLAQHEGQVESLVFQPGGDLLLIGGQDGTARLWHVPTRRPVGPPLEHRESIRVVAFSPDGRLALTAGYDRLARLWPVPEPDPDPIETIAARVRALGGLDLDDDGIIQPLDAARWRQLRGMPDAARR